MKKTIISLLLAVAGSAAFAATWTPVAGNSAVRVDTDSRTKSEIPSLVGKDWYSADVMADLPDGKKVLLQVVFDCSQKVPTVVGQHITALETVDGKDVSTGETVDRTRQPVAPADAAGKMANAVACKQK